MRRALIDERGLVVQVAGEDFPVHRSLRWVDAEDDVEAYRAEWRDGRIERIPDPEPVELAPVRVTRRQALLALAATGQLEQALALFDGLPRTSPHRIEWETSLAFERDHPTTRAMAAQFRISEAQLDALFEAAAKL